jgi:hypothetical protein
VLRIGKWRFHFYSNEGTEPPHIHARSNDGECKFWLVPVVGLAANRGLAPAALREAERLVFEHHDLFRKAFHDFHRR